MSATAVNIATTFAPASALGGAAEGGQGVLGAFDALMSAFFGLPEGTTGAAPALGDQAANGLPSTPPAIDIPAPGVETAPAAPAQPAAPAGAAQAFPTIAAGDDVKSPDAKKDAGKTVEVRKDGAELDPDASAEAAMLALFAPPPAPLVPTASLKDAAPTNDGATGGTPTPVRQDASPSPQPVFPAAPDVELPDAAAAAPAAAMLSTVPAKPEPPAQATPADRPVPGARASDTAREHAAPRSAVAAAAAQIEPQSPPPAPAAANAPAIASAEPPAAAPPPPAPPAPQAQKSNGKPARAEREGTPADARPLVASPPPPRQPDVAAAGQTKADKAPWPPELAEAETKPSAPDAPESAPLTAEPSRAADGAARAAAADAPAVRGSPETVANLAAQIVRKLGARSTHFDVQLDPAGLGRVNVRIEINADGRVSAAMRFDNPQAAAELRSRANDLHRALAQSGFDLSGGLSFDVAQDSRGGYPGQSQNPFAGDDTPGRAFRGRAFAAALETAGEAGPSPLSSRPPGAGARGVDVRV